MIFYWSVTYESITSGSVIEWGFSNILEHKIISLICLENVFVQSSSNFTTSKIFEIWVGCIFEGKCIVII